MKIVTFGELMLRLTPPDGKRFTQTDCFEAWYGGAEANVATSLSVFGDKTEFVSKLPEHAVGQAAVNALRRWGVGTRYLLRGGDRIGVYYLESGVSQRPSQVIYDRAGSAVAQAKAEEFDWVPIFSGADWFHLTGITPALSPELKQACLAACRTAKERGVTVSFDPNYRAKLWSVERAGETMEEILPYVDVLITNENQATQLFGLRVPPEEISGDDVSDAGYLALAKQIRARFGTPVVALTERRTVSSDVNRFCAKLYDGHGLVSSDCYTIQILDRVGAGDAFAAGLIHALGHGWDPEKAVRFAAAASCLKHTVLGDVNLVSEEEVFSLAEGALNGRVQR